MNQFRLLTIAWAVSAEAIRKSTVAQARGVDRSAFTAFSSADATITLSIELENPSSDGANSGSDVGSETGTETGAVVATLTPPRGTPAAFASQLTEAAFGRWELDEREHLLHLTINEPTSDTPLLVATVRLESDSSVSVLYARTTLLAHLGIPGGRYEVTGATLSEDVASNVHAR